MQRSSKATRRRPAAAFLLAMLLFCLPSTSHAQFMLNDAVGGFNAQIRTINRELRTFDKELKKLKQDYNQVGGCANLNLPQNAKYRAKFERKWKRLSDRRQALDNIINERINPGIEYVSGLPKSMVDDGVQMATDKATGQVKNNKYYKKVAPKAKGVLEKVKIAQRVLNKVLCPGPIIANALADKLVEMANFPTLAFKVLCLPPLPSINFMKIFLKKFISKILSPICFSADFMKLIPDLPKIPDLTKFIPNIPLPKVPSLPSFPKPGIGGTNICMIQSLPSLPISIPTLPTIEFVRPTLPSLPSFGFSFSLGCISINGLGGPGPSVTVDNQDAVQLIKDMQQSGELPPPPKK